MGYIVLTVAFDGILVMLCSEYVLGPRVVSSVAVRQVGGAGPSASALPRFRHPCEFHSFYAYYVPTRSHRVPLRFDLYLYAIGVCLEAIECATACPVCEQDILSLCLYSVYLLFSFGETFLAKTLPPTSV